MHIENNAMHVPLFLQLDISIHEHVYPESLIDISVDHPLKNCCVGTAYQINLL